MKFSIRLLYLYLFSFVGLLITIIGGIQLIDLGIKTYVFKVSEYSVYTEPMGIDSKQPTISAEEMNKRNKIEESNQRKRQLSTSLSMILIGTPVYLYHWKTIKKESKENA